MSAPLRFAIDNGDEVTIYETSAEFLDAMLDLLNHNPCVNLESTRKGQEVYVTIL